MVQYVHTEKFLESCWIKPNSDCNYTFRLILHLAEFRLVPNTISSSRSIKITDNHNPNLVEYKNIKKSVPRCALLSWCQTTRKSVITIQFQFYLWKLKNQIPGVHFSVCGECGHACVILKSDPIYAHRCVQHLLSERLRLSA